MYLCIGKFYNTRNLIEKLFNVDVEKMKVTKSAYGAFVSFQFVLFRNADKAVRSAQK